MAEPAAPNLAEVIAGKASAQVPFAAYVHIPFCSVRCGYCDFNTYVADFGPGAARASFHHSVVREIEWAADALNTAPALDTIFFGGGTPTQLPARHLAAITEALTHTWGAHPNLEVTTEANPDSIDEAYCEELAAAGFTRVSLGMQSSDPHILQLLDRTHNPANVRRAVHAARRSGLAVSLDLIYGTPGESAASWEATVHAALELAPDHISAYALGIEPGTKLGAAQARGDFPPVNPDEQAERYELADELLHAASYSWYEVSNWARTGHECRHNLHYWRGANWWGFGPGAHSHVAGVRWMNTKHPLAYATSFARGGPATDIEQLTAEQREEERVMLGIRLAEGLPIPTTPPAVIAELVDDGLITAAGAATGRAILTRRGRLLADHVTYRLLGI